MNSPIPLVLASNSPRRRNLLTDLGFAFEVRSKNIPEDFPDDLPAAEVPVWLARLKAEALRSEISNHVVLAADTVVVVEDQILNKPADAYEAYRMLQLLSGRRHEVITGVCVLSRERIVEFSDLTEVWFRELAGAEIDYYVHHFQPFDKAGAYGAQEWLGMVAIDMIVGSYFNVMGLPVHKVYRTLREFGLIPQRAAF